MIGLNCLWSYFKKKSRINSVLFINNRNKKTELTGWPVTTKKNSVIRKNSRKYNKYIFYDNNYENNNYKQPKVRIN